MPGDTANVFGVPVPSVDPMFLAVVRFHILVGVGCVVAGAIAMLSPKSRGRHSAFGNNLLLVLDGGRRYGDRAFGGPLGRELPPVRSRHAVLDCSHHREDSSASALAQLYQAAHHRYGFVLHFDADGILRRQW